MTSDESYVLSCLMDHVDNVCAAFGILGNIKAESNCRGNNLQNSYEKKLGFTDETYTKAIDNGSYTEEQFIRDGAGYGLCQWTYWSRKQALYCFWKEQIPSPEMIFSISDVDLQVSFLFKEISTSLMDKLLNCTTIEEATRLFMLEYEKPADQSEENIKRRCEISKQLYLDYMKSSVRTTDEIYEMDEWSLGDEIVDKLGAIVELLERIVKKLEKENK